MISTGRPAMMFLIIHQPTPDGEGLDRCKMVPRQIIAQPRRAGAECVLGAAQVLALPVGGEDAGAAETEQLRPAV